MRDSKHENGNPAICPRGPFAIIALDGGVFLQFAEPGINDIRMQHFALLVDDQRFDEIYQRLVNAGIEH
jgi:hypothetical protein